ncbi:Adhesive plaque matrix protein [Balamuthia mandrillaris]
MLTLFSPQRACSPGNLKSPRTCLKQYQVAENPTRDEQQPRSRHKATATKNKRLTGKHGQVWIVHNKAKAPPQRAKETENEDSEANRSNQKLYAIKRQPIETAEARERGHRECAIYALLRDLHFQNKTFNFVLLHDWMQCETDREPLFCQQEEEEAKEAEAEEEEKEAFIHFVMEYVERPLNSCQNLLSLEEVREILFQTLWGLAVAENDLEFVHNDLHPRNVLLRSLNRSAEDEEEGEGEEEAEEEKSCCVYIDEDGQHFYTWRYVVKIADFGLSRIKTERGEILYNKRITMQELFMPQTDLNFVAAWKWGPTVRCKVLNDLRAKLRKIDANAALLLKHPFFEPLRQQPNFFSEERCTVVSRNGLAGIPPELRAQALYPVSEASPPRVPTPLELFPSSPLPSSSSSTTKRGLLSSPLPSRLHPSSPFWSPPPFKGLLSPSRNSTSTSTTKEATSASPFASPLHPSSRASKRRLAKRRAVPLSPASKLVQEAKNTRARRSLALHTKETTNNSSNNANKENQANNNNNNNEPERNRKTAPQPLRRSQRVRRKPVL